MKTYLAKFHGREAGAIGIFSAHTATVQAANEEAARLKLYDTHEHITRLQLLPVPICSPFDAEGLILLIQNDAKLHEAIRSAVQRLQDTVDRAAEQFARANRDWHDDPAGEDHEAFHADSLTQLPRPERSKALRELVDRHLEVINESAAFWPEDFAKLQPGDPLILKDGTPATVEDGPHGKGNAWINVVYKHDQHGPLVRRSAQWSDIHAANHATITA